MKKTGWIGIGLLAGLLICSSAFAGQQLYSGWESAVAKHGLEKERVFAAVNKGLKRFDTCHTKWVMSLKARDSYGQKMERLRKQGVDYCEEILDALEKNEKKNKEAIKLVKWFIRDMTSEDGIGKVGSPKERLSGPLKADTARSWKPSHKKMPRKLRKLAKKNMKVWQKFDSVSQKRDGIIAKMVGYRTCIVTACDDLKAPLETLKKFKFKDKGAAKEIGKLRKAIKKELGKFYNM